eukprot:jgi/Galph1/3782/GphlegSOOS_G2440.1
MGGLLIQAASVLVGVHACFLPFLWCFKSAPFCPSTTMTVSTFTKLCKEFATQQHIPPTKLRVLDLGSGSGTVLFAAAAEAGLKMRQDMKGIHVWWTRRKINAKGVSSLVRVHRRSLFSADLSQADVIYFFAVPSMLVDLEKKLESDLPRHRPVLIASNGFALPSWKPYILKNGLYIYRHELCSTKDSFSTLR